MDNFEFKGPVLLVGIGGLGRKIALEAKSCTDFDCMVISNDKRDVEDKNSLYVDCRPWINPGIFRIRSYLQNYESEIMKIFSRYGTVILISNLGGNSGTAISPLLSNIAKFSLDLKVINFVVMPFRYEKERLFNSAVSLKRLNSASDAVFVIDNDAFLEINPDLSLEECFSITNKTLVHIIKLMPSINLPPGKRIISTSSSEELGVENALRDSLAMLYSSSDPDSLGKSFLYINNGIAGSIGNLNSIIDKLRKIQNIDRNAEIDLSPSRTFDRPVNLVTLVQGHSKFDSYDPLAIIPGDSCLDWEIPESHPDIVLPLSNIE
ncbi:MAG: hypothetical protein WBP88_02110 [Nitrososphaeraceae archaeon]